MVFVFIQFRKVLKHPLVNNVDKICGNNPRSFVLEINLVVINTDKTLYNPTTRFSNSYNTSTLRFRRHGVLYGIIFKI